MTHYDVITISDMCADLMIWGEDLIPDFVQKEKLLQGYKLEMGGSSNIFACQCAKLGLRTAVIGTVGNDILGGFTLKCLKDAGVDISSVICRDDITTGLGISMCYHNKRAIFSFLGSADATEFSQIPWESIGNARHLHIASYFLMSRIRPYIPRIIELARKANMSISLDTNWDPEEKWNDGINEILSKVDLFLPNENEVKSIMGESDIEIALKKASSVVKNCVVKCGEKGAVCIDNGKLIWWNAHDVKIVDSVGAGDSFDAGFIYGWLNGLSIYECGEIAMICSEGNIQESGGVRGQPTLEQVRKRICVHKGDTGGRTGE